MEFVSVQTVDTLDTLKHSSDLRENMVILTLGEKEINDGKSGLYYVVQKSSQKVKCDDFIFCDKSSPFKLVPIRNGAISVLDDKVAGYNAIVTSLMQNSGGNRDD